VGATWRYIGTKEHQGHRKFALARRFTRQLVAFLFQKLFFNFLAFGMDSYNFPLVNFMLNHSANADRVWAFGRLGVWAFGRLGVWAFGRLGVWAFGRLGVWA
jgi:hypothetical protein